jgi:hypothetical protein
MGKHRRIDDAETDIIAQEVPLDEARSGPMSLRSHGFKPMFRGFEVTEKMPQAADQLNGNIGAIRDLGEGSDQ